MPWHNVYQPESNIERNASDYHLIHHNLPSKGTCTHGINKIKQPEKKYKRVHKQKSEHATTAHIGIVLLLFAFLNVIRLRLMCIFFLFVKKKLFTQWTSVLSWVETFCVLEKKWMRTSICTHVYCFPTPHLKNKRYTYIQTLFSYHLIPMNEKKGN